MHGTASELRSISDERRWCGFAAPHPGGLLDRSLVFKVGYRGMPATEAFFRPYEDQWSFLSGVRRMSRAEVATIVEHASATGRIVGVRLPIDDDDEAPWMAPPSRRGTTLPIFGALPESVEVVLSNHFTLTGVGFRRQSSIA
jgi:hypothetical protein